MNLLVVEKPREKQLQQIRGDQADGALRCQVLPVQIVDSPMPRIGCEQLLRQLCHRDMHPASIPHPARKGKSTGGLVCSVATNVSSWLISLRPTFWILFCLPPIKSAGRAAWSGSPPRAH